MIVLAWVGDGWCVACGIFHPPLLHNLCYSTKRPTKKSMKANYEETMQCSDLLVFFVCFFFLDVVWPSLFCVCLVHTVEDHFDERQL